MSLILIQEKNERRTREVNKLLVYWAEAEFVAMGQALISL